MGTVKKRVGDERDQGRAGYDKEKQWAGDLSFFFNGTRLSLIRLDHQPLFGKGSRAGRDADQTRESGGNRA